MKNKGRSVVFEYYNEDSEKKFKGEGIFQRWGSDAQLRDDNYYQITFAVIEDSEGNVHRLNENQIKFTDTKIRL